MTQEHRRALMEAARNEVSDAYFAARAQWLSGNQFQRRIFDAGFDRAWDRLIDLAEVLRDLVEAVEDNDRDSLRELIAAHEALASVLPLNAVISGATCRISQPTQK